MSTEQQPSDAQDTFERSLAKAVTRLISADVLVAAAGMLAGIALARAAGVDALALYALAFAWLAVIEIIIDFGSDLHVARAIGADSTATGPIVRQVTRFKWHCAAVALPIALAITLILSSQLYSAQYLIAVLLLAPVRTHAQTSAAALRALQATNILSRLQGAIGSTQFLAAAVVIWWTADLMLMLAAIAAGDILRAVLLRRAVTQRTPASVSAQNTAKSTTGALPTSSLHATVDMLRGNFGLALINFSSVMINRAPLFLLEYLVGRTATGFYAAATRFIAILRMLPGVVFNVLLPGFASNGKKSRLVLRALLGALVTAVPISLGLAWAADWLLPWLLGEDFRPAVPVLQILSGRFVIHMLVHVFEAQLLAAGRENMVNRVFAIELALLLLGATIVFPAHGAIGAAWLTLITHAISCVALAILTKLYFDHTQALPEPDRSA